MSKKDLTEENVIKAIQNIAEYEKRTGKRLSFIPCSCYLDIERTKKILNEGTIEEDQHES